MRLSKRCFTTLTLAALAFFPFQARGEIRLKASLDNLDVGGAIGEATTSIEPFLVVDYFGPTIGTAGGNVSSEEPTKTDEFHVIAGATGQIGEALTFSGGENAGVTFGDVLDPGDGDYSASLWFNFDGEGQNSFLASKGNRSSSDNGWSIFFENGNLIYRMGLGGGGGDARAAVVAPVDATSTDWHHAALVIDFDESVVRGYLDGVEATGIGFGGPPDGTFVVDEDGVVAEEFPLLLGTRVNGGFDFTGSLDDFQIYDEALSENDIQAIYQAGLAGESLVIGAPTLDGDFNGDGNFDCGDADLLVGDIVAGTNSADFDLNADSQVNATDLDLWLADAATQNGFSEPFKKGDANLDGTINATDLNQVGLSWQASPNTWCGADFNADGTVNATDLNEIGVGWQQTLSSAAMPAQVPEPTGSLLFGWSLALLMALMRRK